MQGLVAGNQAKPRKPRQAQEKKLGRPKKSEQEASASTAPGGSPKGEKKSPSKNKTAGKKKAEKKNPAKPKKPSSLLKQEWFKFRAEYAKQHAGEGKKIQVLNKEAAVQLLDFLTFIVS